MKIIVKRNMCCLTFIAFFSAHVALCNSLGEIQSFLKAFFNDPSTVGAIFPSSSLVGNELVKYMVQTIAEHPDRPLRILEVGSGTGCMTQVIADNLRDIDHLDAVEISEQMCIGLHNKFDKFGNVAVHCISILDWNPKYQYDFIISTLPFNSLDFKLTITIIDHLTQLIKTNGVLSYVAYTGIAQIKEVFLWGKNKKKHQLKMKKLHELRNQFEIDAQTILRNIPPINIYHLQIV